MCEIADSTATVPYSTVLLFSIVQYTTVLYCKLVYSTVLYLLQPSVHHKDVQGEAVIGREHVGLPNVQPRIRQERRQLQTWGGSTQGC